jgi:hypothetical protein
MKYITKRKRISIQFIKMKSGYRFSMVIYLVVAETAVGNPLSNASEGGRIDMLREWEGITQSELRQGSGTSELFAREVRLEAFPTGSPMSVG